MPTLGFYNLTVPKDEAVVALATDGGDPLLAHWNYGLGRSVAFMSGANSRWAAQWLTWSDFSRFWDGVTRWTMSAPVDRRLQPAITVAPSAGGGYGLARLSVESLAPDNSFADLANLTVAVRAPSGAITATRLLQTAPGRYDATIPLAEPGAYEARFATVGGAPP